MASRFVLALFIFLLLAGCLGKNASPAPSGKSPSASGIGSGTRSESTSGGSVPLAVGNVSQTIAFDGCGKGLSALIYAPQELYPGASPPEPSWAAGSPLVAITVFVEECTRISVGPYERGPVHFLLEINDNMAAPASCRSVPGDYTSDNSLSQLW